MLRRRDGPGSVNPNQIDLTLGGRSAAPPVGRDEVARATRHRRRRGLGEEAREGEVAAGWGREGRGGRRERRQVGTNG
jgi:hypothetical protein